jgi:transcriptional regulator with XRE-family HTH domain
MKNELLITLKEDYSGRLRGMKGYRKLSNETISEGTGLSHPTIGRVLNGDPSVKYSSVIMLAQYLDVEVRIGLEYLNGEAK